jgi:hypothetical protein
LFHPDDGETIDIKAADSVYFDESSKGTWEVLETVRKAYLTFKRNQEIAGENQDDCRRQQTAASPN